MNYGVKKKQTEKATFVPEALGIRKPEVPGSLTPDPGVAILVGLFKPLGFDLGVAGSAREMGSLPSSSSNTTTLKQEM